MPKPKPLQAFIFNDETQENSYGFSILTEGIDLTRFMKNPVMLSDHWNSNWNVIGKWNDVKKEGAILTGLPEFDTEDTDAALIAGKVERGFIKGCSMGIVFDRENLSLIGGKVVLTKCELVEVSVVPVPSNANSVRLFYEDGKVMDEKEIQELSLSVIPSIINPELNLKIDNMKKIILSAAALMVLGFKDQVPAEGVDATEVESKILSLSAELEKVKGQNAALELAAKTAKEAQEAAAKLAIEKKVKLAITEGKFGADKEAEMVALGLASESALDTVIGSIMPKQNFSAGVTSPTGAVGTEVKTMDDFQKLSLDAQLAFKNDNPDEYKKLFN
ncbi:HK97 family phage prohead protease [Flavobacterium sp. N2820]|uniref:HK97 family phage prohead protease n=1 Tax=Flavobacterium sp. N2820 TaxID=2986834 RepID=UPI002223F9C7|nr:HK97 family phage prohead protease [Flavobacterium sp. N2820]